MPYGKAIALVLVAMFGFIPGAQAQAPAENVGAVQLTLVRKPADGLVVNVFQAILGEELVGNEAQKLDYFMTANPAELAAITGSGWHAIPMDGQIFVYDRWVEGTVPLYRFLHPRWGQHFFTWNRSEAQSAVRNNGYKPEGICCYISPSPTPDTVPLYRLRRTVGVQVHRYVTNEYEKERLNQSGIWFFEGIAGYVWPRTTTAALHAGSLEPLCFDGSSTQSLGGAGLADQVGTTVNDRDRDSAITEALKGVQNPNIATHCVP